MYQNNHTYQGGAYPQMNGSNRFWNQQETVGINSFNPQSTAGSSNCGCSENNAQVQQVPYYGNTGVIPPWQANLKQQYPQPVPGSYDVYPNPGYQGGWTPPYPMTPYPGSGYSTPDVYPPTGGYQGYQGGHQWAPPSDFPMTPPTNYRMPTTSEFSNNLDTQSDNN